MGTDEFVPAYFFLHTLTARKSIRRAAGEIRDVADTSDAGFDGSV